jgi:hypothetical protein
MHGGLTNLRFFARLALGVFLIVAAFLKVHGLVVDSLKTELLGIPVSVQLIAVQFELLLGLWLLSGTRSQWAFTATAVFFAGASFFAAKQVLNRQTTCGCFGALDVNPIYTLSLDLALLVFLVGLVVFGPREHLPLSQGTKPIRYIAGFMALLSILIAFPGIVGLIDYPELIRSIKGDTVDILPRVKDIGDTLAFEKATVRIDMGSVRADTTELCQRGVNVGASRAP